MRRCGVEFPLVLKTLRTTRYHMLKEIEGLTKEELLAIPDSRDDNVLWNVGHLLCSLSRLTYLRSGHPLPIPETYLSLFGKGTDARQWTSAPDPEDVLERFASVLDQIETDYGEGLFEDYETLEIAPGHTIDSVEEAIAFHCFHEGLHIGMVISIKQLLEFTAVK